jgi:hypothetical protein
MFCGVVVFLWFFMAIIVIMVIMTIMFIIVIMVIKVIMVPKIIMFIVVSWLLKKKNKKKLRKD